MKPCQEHSAKLRIVWFTLGWVLGTIVTAIVLHYNIGF